MNQTGRVQDALGADRQGPDGEAADLTGGVQDALSADRQGRVQTRQAVFICFM